MLGIKAGGVNNFYLFGLKKSAFLRINKQVIIDNLIVGTVASKDAS